MVTKTKRAKKKKPDQKRSERGTGKELASREYLFESTPVLVTLPTHLYKGPVLEAVLTGSWKVRPTSPSELRVTGLNAYLFLPKTLVRLEGYEGFVELGGEPITLRQSTFKVPKHVERQFGALNAGTFAWRERFVSTTVGFRATDETFGALKGVFTTIGFVGEDSVLMSGGVAVILTGLLRGAILCCCAPRRPRQDPPPGSAPPPGACDGRCTPKDSGPTYDGNDQTDLQKAPFQDGARKVEVPLTPGGPTAADELGFVEGEYPSITLSDGSVTPVYRGFFKKIEVEITADAPCTIVSVTRTMTRLAGHDSTNQHPPDTPDPIKPSSIPVQTPQRWVITDAPGILTLRTVNRIYHKQFTVTATFDRGGQQFTRSCTYTVLVRTDANGKIIPNPTPP